MKESIAVLSALIIGLSYCSPGIVAVAADDSKAAAGNQNTEATQAPSANEKKMPVDQVSSVDDEDSPVEQEPTVDNESSLAERLWKKITGVGEKESLQKNPDTEIQQITQIENYKPEAPVSEIKNLQIPQKLAVVIDPWEMDGKGQVYSEPYIVRNTGDTPGILTLSNLTCRPREQSGVVVKTDKEGLHDSGDKSIYIEMMLGNENRIIFTTEKSQYQTELNPGEELDIRFVGEVNENAFEEWTNQDVAISVVYSWESKGEQNDLNLEEGQSDDSVEDELNESQWADAGERKSADRKHAEKSEEEPADQQQADPKDVDNQQETESEDGEQGSNIQEETGKGQSDSLQTGANQENINGSESDTETLNGETQQDASTSNNVVDKKESEIDYSMEADKSDGNSEDIAKDLKIDEETAGFEEKVKEEIKNIELLEPQKVDVNIDSWKIDEKGRIVSQQYLLYNAGDTTGTWTLSDLICKPYEQNRVRVTADKKTLHGNGDKAVYMELVLENGENVVLSQASSTYEVKLKAGEKLEVRFIGEMNGNLFESREEGDIVVTAVCSWNRD